MNWKILVAVALVVLAACQNEQYMVYEDDARLQFGPTLDKIYTEQSSYEDTLKNFSFLSVPSDKKIDTVYFDLYCMGRVSDVDRPYKLEQVILDSVANAEAGVHFMDFDDPNLEDMYIMPARSSHVLVPVIVLRDTSLSSKEYVLEFQIKENEYFKLGDSTLMWRRLIVADVVVKPTLWSDALFGTYSKVKHRFMQDQTGMLWDDEDIKVMNSDISMQYYWQGRFQKLLYEYNNDLANEDVPLRDENGVLVEF